MPEPKLHAATFLTISPPPPRGSAAPGAQHRSKGGPSWCHPPAAQLRPRPRREQTALPVRPYQ